MKLPKHIQEAHNTFQKKLLAYADKIVRPEDALRWKGGKFKGRKCTVKKVLVDKFYHPEQKEDVLVICVFVKTKKADGFGFVNENDLFHRQSYELATNFEFL